MLCITKKPFNPSNKDISALELPYSGHKAWIFKALRKNQITSIIFKKKSFNNNALH